MLGVVSVDRPQGGGSAGSGRLTDAPYCFPRMLLLCQWRRAGLNGKRGHGEKEPKALPPTFRESRPQIRKRLKGNGMARMSEIKRSWRGNTEK